MLVSVMALLILLGLAGGAEDRQVRELEEGVREGLGSLLRVGTRAFTSRQ